MPAVRAGQRVIIAAHGNSLRALVKYLDGIADDKIVGLNIPTGIPLVYELDDDLKPIRSFYLGDPEAIANKRPRRLLVSYVNRLNAKTMIRRSAIWNSKDKLGASKG